MIIAASGKNVYPDELEDYFTKHPNIEEIAVVGLPDGSGGERVAALIRPDYDSEPDLVVILLRLRGKAGRRERGQSCELATLG